MDTTTKAHTLGAVTLHATPNPDPQVVRIGFPLSHPYVDVCWTAVLGPTGGVMLRRIDGLWIDSLSPTLDTADLASMVGIGRGTGRHSPVWRTITRLERFGIVRAIGPGQLEVSTELPPLHPRDLGRTSGWVQDQHARLLDAHLADLAAA